jgi:hypothetical protein
VWRASGDCVWTFWLDYFNFLWYNFIAWNLRHLYFKLLQDGGDFLHWRFYILPLVPKSAVGFRLVLKNKSPNFFGLFIILNSIYTWHYTLWFWGWNGELNMFCFK